MFFLRRKKRPVSGTNFALGMLLGTAVAVGAVAAFPEHRRMICRNAMRAKRMCMGLMK